jgi:serine phosphatase RsbU (regulator of sigma subunit)
MQTLSAIQFSGLLFAVIILIAILLAYYFMQRHFNKKKSQINHLYAQLENERNEVKSLFKSNSEEKEKFETEKKKAQEKNRKIWEMSETVYKEKKKVDEELGLLQIEKDKLETEKKKVDEKVKKLWTQSTAIHKEKERINEIKIEIEIKHREVIDSVNYAKRIQEAILPSSREILECFPDSFILFKPRNIVSGDFYWLSQKDGKKIIACVDCTGHGVPGAFMSMIGNTLLNQIVNEKGITEPAEILNQLNKEVTYALRQSESGSSSRDGMDIAICSFEYSVPSENDSNMANTTILNYAGANRPLYYIRNNELEEIKADKFPIGGLDAENVKKFTTKTFLLHPNDYICVTTDGYADQFGQADDKKLKTKKFKEILLSIYQTPFEEQRRYLDSFIENWKGNQEQTDDMLVIGIKV